MKKYIKLAVLILVSSQLFAQKQIWGTVSNGGRFGNGYIFKTDSIGENLNIVHHFNNIDGNAPGALLAGSDNKLYGVTSSGGTYDLGPFGGGVFYEYDLTTNTFTALESFGAGNPRVTGVQPDGYGFRSLTEVSPGIIYGQVKRGSAVGCNIFKWNALTQSMSTALTLPTFQGGFRNEILGNRLTGSLYLAVDGFLYGTTHTNSQCPVGYPNGGSIIRIDPATNAFSIRYLSPCLATDGGQFDNQFAVYNNTFYSIAQTGGANNKGVIYSFDPATSTYTNRYNFEESLLGDYPSPMVAASNGKFYGTMGAGGTPEQNAPSGSGILYEFDPVNNSYSKKLDFTYGDGSYMNVGRFGSGLINANNGKLYGVTQNGVFEYNPTSNQNSAKARFLGDEDWYMCCYPAATPSLTFVCRKPSYNFANNTNHILSTGTNFSIDLNSENTTSVVWKHNGIIDPLQTSTILSLTDVDDSEIGSWRAELTNECGTTIAKTIQISVTPAGLPVNLISFTAKQTSNGTLLKWITAQEKQNKGFQILRSLDGINFTVIGDVKPSQIDGNATGQSDYSFMDTEFTNEAYYQLKQIDKNGREELFNIIHVGASLKIKQVSVYPNPAIDSFNILTPYNNSVITITSSEGKVVKSLISNTKATTVNPKNWAPGIYLIQVKSGNESSIVKLLIGK